MRVGLLSDTHILHEGEELPPQVAEAFYGVDLILHAGDIYIPSVLDELERIAPVLAAEGDGDDYGDILTDERVKQKHILRLEGQTLWLIHERPSRLYTSLSQRSGHSEGKDAPDTPDVVVFGHEHRTVVENHGDTLFVNPGSPTFLNYHHGLGTVCILDINSGQARAHILQL